jgi:hypothetical protein
MPRRTLATRIKMLASGFTPPVSACVASLATLYCMLEPSDEYKDDILGYAAHLYWNIGANSVITYYGVEFLRNYVSQRQNGSHMLGG